MKVITWDEFLGGKSFGNKQAAMTLGVFDGVHVGHQKLINEVHRDPTHFPVLFTFRESPAAVIPGRSFPGHIQTLDQKLDRLEELGIKGVVIIDFSPDFGKLTGKEFLFLVWDKLHYVKLVLGPNHKLGHNGLTASSEAPEILQGKNVEVIIPSQVELRGSIVSSTRIRKAVHGGHIDLACEMLGQGFSIDLRGFDFLEGKTGQKERASDSVIEANSKGFLYKVPVEAVSAKQILPLPGCYSINVKTNQEFFATKLTLDEQYIIWNQEKKIPAEQLVFAKSDKPDFT